MREPLLGKIALHAALGVAGAVAMFPFAFSLATSFKQPAHAFSPGLVPRPPTAANYVEVVRTTPLFLTWVANSVLVAAAAVVALVALGLMAGYALARIPFPGRGALLLLILAGMMVPQQVLWIPNYETLARLGWVNTYAGLVPGFVVTLSQGVFLVSQFLKNLPKELEEAARLDGLSRYAIFWRIVLPLSGPIVGSMVVTSFMASWNMFAWPVIVLNSPELFTLPMGLDFFKGLYVTRWTLIMAASMFNTLPVVAVFVAFQRYFVKGVATTGMKD